MDEVVNNVHREKGLVIVAFFNRRVFEGKRGDDEVLYRDSVKERNAGKTVVDFPKRNCPVSKHTSPSWKSSTQGVCPII